MIVLKKDTKWCAEKTLALALFEYFDRDLDTMEKT